jgi:hypothetical protein
MGYDSAKYTAMRSAGLGHKTSLGLSQDSLPNIGSDPAAPATVSPLTALDPAADLPTTIDKINEIVDALNQLHGA